MHRLAGTSVDRRLYCVLAWLVRVTVTDDDDDDDRLHWAAQEGDLETVKRLIAEGTPINAFDDLGHAPLHYAAAKEHLGVVKYLIAAGADVNAQDESRAGNTVLGHVAQRCSFELAVILISAGADPTRPGSMQLTPLVKASERKRGDGPRVYRLMLGATKRG